MISKIINNDQFCDAIKIAFDKDDKIFSLYCPLVEVKKLEDIVNDISDRIKSDVPCATIKGVYDKNKLIGYYVYDLEVKSLVSFGLNIEYRKRKYLKEFFSLIRDDLKGRWQILLWSRNIRGIKWLIKNGLKINSENNLITHLIY
jgi:hypothetical protein